MKFQQLAQVIPNQQRSGLWWLLLATILLSLWLAIQTEDEETTVDLVAPAKSQHKQASARKLPVLNITNTTDSKMGAHYWKAFNRDSTSNNYPNLFPVQSWAVVAKPIQVKPAPLPPPSAPNVPFIYMGKLEDESSGTQVFLMLNNKVYSVSKGGLVDAMWRLDREDTQQLFFTYLPLNLPQTLSKSTKVNSAYLPDASTQN